MSQNQNLYQKNFGAFQILTKANLNNYLDGKIRKKKFIFFVFDLRKEIPEDLFRTVTTVLNFINRTCDVAVHLLNIDHVIRQ